MMDKALCEFKYITTCSDSKTKTVTVKINILDFKRLIETRNAPKLFGISKKNYAEDADPDVKFEIRMKVEGKERELLEIYYLAPIPVFLRAYCYMLDRNGSRSQATAIRHDRSGVCDYQLLAVLFKQEMFNAISIAQMTSGRLCLEFQFVIDKNICIADEYKLLPKTNLTSNLGNLLNDSTLSDVIIKSVEGEELPAHKAILTARSEVFKAHFDHGTKEATTNIIESNFETEVLQEMLHYLYTDSPPVKLDEMPYKILIAADYYHLDGLKVLCEKKLCDLLSVDNALRTLEIAESHFAENLKELTLKFINDGNLEEVIKTEAWKSIKSVDLVKSICEYKCK